MHGEVSLGGPLWWIAATLLVIAGLLGAFVVFDSWKVRRAAFERLPEPRWVYTVVQGTYVLALLAAQMPGVPALVGGIVVLVTPLAIAVSLAYLLRVVFPRAG